MNTTKYFVTKHFVGGLLNGITAEFEQSFPVEVGMVVRKPIGGSPYKVIACRKA